MNVHERLKSERERLNLSQTGFADLAKVGKTTVINWEKGASSPDAVQLSALADAGADVLYILTGQRSVAVAPQALLPEGDRILLDNFHAAPAGVQAGVKTTLGAFASTAGPAKRRKAG